MEIVWYGLNTFRFSERGMASVVTDPYPPEVGLTYPRPRADIVTVSRNTPECSYTRGVRGPFRVFDTPGEYEVGGVFVTAIPTIVGPKKSPERNIIFHFDYDGLTICHLGHLDRVPTQAHIEALGAVDILLVPIGGDGGLKPAKAAEVISLLEPSIVIPMRYKIPGLKMSLGSLSRFLQQMGLEKAKPQEALKISRHRLPSETEVVVLTPRVE
ncbi:MAG TPA: MBL fold metallo-hydrolase [Thermoflexia bacterium]|jgi:L-ascorbate metabolism protein UlaG (beta-lactamase superfamily)|nr:MBL fold metallo-hydrolase [Thermoflexia bacterium]